MNCKIIHYIQQLKAPTCYEVWPKGFWTTKIRDAWFHAYMQYNRFTDPEIFPWKWGRTFLSHPVTQHSLLSWVMQSENSTDVSATLPLLSLSLITKGVHYFSASIQIQNNFLPVLIFLTSRTFQKYFNSHFPYV
jgi:hypothetical protein